MLSAGLLDSIGGAFDRARSGTRARVGETRRMVCFRRAALAGALAAGITSCAHRVPQPSSAASLAPAPARPQTARTPRVLYVPPMAPTAPPSSAIPSSPSLRTAAKPTPAGLDVLPEPSAAFRALPFSVFALSPQGVPPVRRVMRVPSLVPHLAPDAPPQIVAVEMPSETVKGGETVIGGVIASSNVASVEVRVAGYSRAMEKIGAGRFAIAITVPRLPFFLRNRTYSIEVIARNTRGDFVAQTVPVTVR